MVGVVDTVGVSMADFNGIVEYHDGLVISDYVNMIPLGTTCVDRVGDSIAVPPPDGLKFDVRGSFIDSHNNIYVAYGMKLYRYVYDEISNTVGSPEIMKMFVDDTLVEFEFINKEHRVTFCESSLKPSEVFACDGKLIYAWATYDGLARPQYAKFNVNVLCPPNITRTQKTEHGVIVSWPDSVSQPDFNSIIYGDDKNTSSGVSLWNQFAEVATDMIDWFDNRLVATQLIKNTVWLTRTDPMYYWRDANSNVPYLEADDELTGGYELWSNWYSSSSNSDKLLNIAAYNGQLYFFNQHTIEIWGRTGNEDAPIQSNTQQVIHVGGTMPTIIEGVLFFLGIDSMKENFIGAFSDNFNRVSNKEIDRHLTKVKSLEKISQYGETYLFVRLESGDGYVFGSGKWWRWESPIAAEYKLHSSVVREFAVSDNAAIIKFDENLRTSGGKRIPRSIRDGFKQLNRRAIIRRIELVADTGRTDVNTNNTKEEQDKTIYCAISTNRGLSFSGRRYRTLGDAGHNNKVIEWRNFGSGNSILVEIGTSSLHKLQCYDINVDLG